MTHLKRFPIPSVELSLGRPAISQKWWAARMFAAVLSNMVNPSYLRPWIQVKNIRPAIQPATNMATRAVSPTPCAMVWVSKQSWKWEPFVKNIQQYLRTPADNQRQKDAHEYLTDCGAAWPLTAIYLQTQCNPRVGAIALSASQDQAIGRIWENFVPFVKPSQGFRFFSNVLVVDQFQKNWQMFVQRWTFIKSHCAAEMEKKIQATKWKKVLNIIWLRNSFTEEALHCTSNFFQHHLIVSLDFDKTETLLGAWHGSLMIRSCRIFWFTEKFKCYVGKINEHLFPTFQMICSKSITEMI